MYDAIARHRNWSWRRKKKKSRKCKVVKLKILKCRLIFQFCFIHWNAVSSFSFLSSFRLPFLYVKYIHQCVQWRSKCTTWISWLVYFSVSFFLFRFLLLRLKCVLLKHRSDRSVFFSMHRIPWYIVIIVSLRQGSGNNYVCQVHNEFSLPHRTNKSVCLIKTRLMIRLLAGGLTYAPTYIILITANIPRFPY